MKHRITVAAAYGLRTPEDSRRLYRDWANSYDSDFAVAMDYQAPRRIAEAFGRVAAANDRPVLDVGAGTGLVGQHLADMGVSAIHALDISPEMLAQAMKRGCYTRSIEADLTQPLCLADETYGAVVSAGTFTHGHVGPEALDEILRIARPSCLFVLGINAGTFETSGFDNKLARLPIAGLELFEQPIYGERAAPEHRADSVMVAVFRKL